MKSNDHISILIAWQKRMLAIKEFPSKGQKVAFLDKLGCYNDYNVRLITKFMITRLGREVLTDEEIKDWHQFYYKKKFGWKTGRQQGLTLLNRYTAIGYRILRRILAPK